MEKSVAETPDASIWARSLLLLLLPLMALGLYLEGQSYDPGLVELERDSVTQEAAALLPDSLGGLARADSVRSFDEDSLYEYINGHADYFLSGGFRTLAVGDYGSDDAGQPSLVVNLYDMGQALYAFGVMMGELGEDQAPLDVGSIGFRGGEELKFVYGPYYAQLSAFNERVPLNEAAVQLVKAMSQDGAGAEPLDLNFPDLGKPLATHFVKEDYRGLDFLNNVLERSFQWQEQELTAFLVNGPQPEIAQLTERLKTFLDEEDIAVAMRQSGGIDFYQVQDPYEGEWFFVPQSTRLLGIFAHPDAALLKRLTTSNQLE